MLLTKVSFESWGLVPTDSFVLPHCGLRCSSENPQQEAFS